MSCLSLLSSLCFPSGTVLSDRERDLTQTPAVPALSFAANEDVAVMDGDAKTLIRGKIVRKIASNNVSTDEFEVSLNTCLCMCSIHVTYEWLFTLMRLRYALSFREYVVFELSEYILRAMHALYATLFCRDPTRSR